jgi:hypothetical protein
MGANAQTTVPTFTAGQVLTAAQMNASARTGVPVAADAAARDGLFGGTGEKTLAEGQLVYLEDLNVVQYYDGAAWATVGPTPGGLVFINSATFTSATSVSLTADTFTSTYANYRIMFRASVSANSNFTGRLRAAGTDDSAGNYASYGVGVTSTGEANNVSNFSQTSFSFGHCISGNPFVLQLDVFSPKIAERTNLVGAYVGNNSAFDRQAFRSFGNLFDATTSFDSLSIISSAASSLTGTVRVYGYVNS